MLSIDQSLETLASGFRDHVFGLRNKNVHQDILDYASGVSSDEDFFETFEKAFLPRLYLTGDYRLDFLRLTSLRLRVRNLGISWEFGCHNPLILEMRKPKARVGSSV
jgi:hypothetical protein